MVAEEYVLELLNRLDENTRNRVLDRLKQETLLSSGNLAINELKEQKNSKGYVCPHCSSKRVKRNGNHINPKGVKVQKYKCNDCGKIFRDTTNTILANCKKSDRWLEFIEYQLQGLSLRKIAEQMGDISYVSLFYWRHKLLKSLNSIYKDRLTGIVEVDETYFLDSEKGNRNLKREPRQRGGKSKYRGLSNEQNAILAARTTDKKTVFKMAEKGRLSSK